MRHTFIALLASLVLVSLGAPVSAVSAPPGPPGKERPPNILLITTDDQNVDDMRYMRNTVEEIGSQGVTFTDAIAPYPLCCPARASLVTGLFNHNNGVLTNQAPFGGYQALEEHGFADQTIATWLDETASGYDFESSFIGKFLNGYGQGVPEPVPVPAGWDYFAGGLPTNLYAFFGGTINVLDRTAGDVDAEVVTPDEATIRSDWNTSRTIERIDHALDAGSPFFIWQSELAPHAGCAPRDSGGCDWGPPLSAPEDQDTFTDLPLLSMLDPSFNERAVADKPDYISGLQRIGPARIQRLTEVHRERIRSLQAVDRSVDRIIEHLRARGALDNTLVIFTSDNGYVMGQHRFKGKVVPYEPSLRVPLLVRGPKDLVPTPGATVSETVSLIDIPATVAEAAGAVGPLMTREDGSEIDLDGRSILPIIRGERPGWDAIPIEAGDDEATEPDQWWYRGLRTKRWIYVDYEKTREFELYDRLEDPYQLNNLAYRPTHAATRRALADRLAALRDCEGQACRDASGDGIPLPSSDGTPVHPDELGNLGESTQVVTLTAPTWHTTVGTAVGWRKRGRSWRVAAGPFRVRLGTNGLVKPGRARHLTGRTPAGTYDPAHAMGLQADPGTTLSYRRLDGNDRWPFDPRRPASYNVFQPLRTKNARWSEDLEIRFADRAPRYGRVLVMQYNLPAGVYREPSTGERLAKVRANTRLGSFFVHAGTPTPRQGWVAMEASRMRWLLRWVDPARDTKVVVGTPAYLRSNL